MTCSFAKIITAACLVASLAVPVAAQTAVEPVEANADPAAANGATGPVALTEAALAVAEFGRAKSDPTILVGAARALQLIGGRPGEGEAGETGAVKTDKPGAATATRASTDKPAPAEVAAPRDLAAELLDEARLLARGDATVLAAIAAAEEGSTKGSAIRGPGFYDRTIEAESYLDITERFRGGALAEVALRGDGDTDLDLEIYDANGNLICESTSFSDREYCRFMPRRTGAFTIRVLNYGDVWNDARITTN